MIIAQITDLHVRAIGKNCNGFVESNRMLEEAVGALMRLDPRPDVVLATGDLTDCGLVPEYEALRGILARLPMPVYLIPGNHDRRENLRQVFADSPYLPKDGPYLHYVVDDHPVRLIGMDSVIPGQGHGSICAERRAWLADRLAEAPDRPTIVFLHHPPFPTGLKSMDAIGCLDGEAMGAIVRQYPNVLRVLCGHHHRPIQTAWAGTIGSVAPSTAHQVMLDLVDEQAARIMMEPPAYHLHLWSPESGLVTHMAYVGPFNGPYDFTLDPDYPAYEKEAAE